MNNKHKLSPDTSRELITTLKKRFQANMQRHAELDWPDVQERLESQPDKLWSLNEMERTDGEPDVIAYDKKTDRFHFVDCAAESPKDRRSLCYDPEGLASRKKFKPDHSALGMASDMGVEVLNEAQYRTSDPG
jgi:uncharacterized protein DUF4256